MKKLLTIHLTKAVCVLFFTVFLTPCELKAQHAIVETTELLSVFKNAIENATALNQKLIEKRAVLEEEKVGLLKEQKLADLKLADLTREQQSLLQKIVEYETYLSQIKSQLYSEQRVIDDKRKEKNALIGKQKAKEAEYNECKNNRFTPDFICDGIQLLVRLFDSEYEEIELKLKGINDQIAQLNNKIDNYSKQVANTEIEASKYQQEIQENQNQLAVTSMNLEHNKAQVTKMNVVLHDAQVKIENCKNQIKDFGDEIITRENPKARRIATLNAELMQVIAELTYAL